MSIRWMPPIFENLFLDQVFWVYKLKYILF